jgi:hypothetical protein
MFGIVLTRAGRLVRSAVLLILLVAAVAAVMWFAQHAPSMSPVAITDAMWQQGVDAARGR